MAVGATLTLYLLDQPLRLPTTLLYSSLAKRFRRRCTRRTTGVSLKDAPRPRHEPAAPDRPPEASVERLYRDPFLQRFHSWRPRTGDIGFMPLRRLRPLPPNTGSEDPGPVIASKGIRGAPRRTSRLPAESSGTALNVRLTERTAYFASIACASHNWLSAQVTLPRFKSSDFAAAESSW
jgi:hypothetical protein